MTMELIKEMKDGNSEYKLYKLGDYEVDATYRDGELANMQISKDYSKRYLPEIYYNAYAFGNDKRELKIQTTSYGSMTPNEIQEVIKGYEVAIEIVAYLTTEFLNK